MRQSSFLCIGILLYENKYTQRFALGVISRIRILYEKTLNSIPRESRTTSSVANMTADSVNQSACIYLRGMLIR